MGSGAEFRRGGGFRLRCTVIVSASMTRTSVEVSGSACTIEASSSNALMEARSLRRNWRATLARHRLPTVDAVALVAAQRPPPAGAPAAVATC